MKKTNPKNELSILWPIVIYTALYYVICYFNQPKNSRDMPMEQVRFIAALICAFWFFLSVFVLGKNTRFVLFPSKKKKVDIKVKNPGINKINNNELILTDPATGAQRGFHKDPKTGEWVSDDGTSVLDVDKVDDWVKQRIDDRGFLDDEMRKLENRETAFDTDMDAQNKKFKEETKKEEELAKKKLENLEKYYEYTDDEEIIKNRIKRKMEHEEFLRDQQNRLGNVAGLMENTCWVIGKLSDWGIEVLGELTSPFGKYGVKSVYIAARNYGSKWQEAKAYGKNVDEALKRAKIDTIIDLLQTHAPDGYKMMANSEGDGIKYALDAYEKGADGTDIFINYLKGKSIGKARTYAGQFLDDKLSKINFFKSMGKESARRTNELMIQNANKKLPDSVFKSCKTAIRQTATESIKSANKATTEFFKNVGDDVVKEVKDKLSLYNLFL